MNWLALFLLFAFIIIFSGAPIMILSISILLALIYLFKNKDSLQQKTIKNTFSISRKTIILLIFCFLIANIQAVLFNYSRVIAIEEPLLDRFSSKVDDVIFLWQQDFDIYNTDVLQNDTEYSHCRTSECFESVAEKEYSKFVTDDYIAGLNITECLSGLNLECELSAKSQTSTYCLNEAVKKNKCYVSAIGIKNARFIRNSMIISMIESVKSYDYPFKTVDSGVAKVLEIAFIMAISAVKTSMLASSGMEQKDRCLEKYNESPLEFKACLNDYDQEIIRFADLLERNITYMPPLQTPDCAQYNTLKVTERRRLMVQNKIHDTKLPYLRLLRTIDAKALNACNSRLMEYCVINISTCVKPEGFVLTYYAIVQTLDAAATETACISSDMDELNENFKKMMKNELD